MKICSADHGIDLEGLERVPGKTFYLGRRLFRTT